MTGYYLDAAQVGLYGAAVTLASLVALGTELLNPLFLSIITRDFAAGDNRSVVAAYNNNNRWILYFCLPVALFTVIMSQELMVFLWGDEFKAGTVTLMLLCGGTVPVQPGEHQLSGTVDAWRGDFPLGLKPLGCLTQCGIEFPAHPVVRDRGRRPGYRLFTGPACHVDNWLGADPSPGAGHACLFSPHTGGGSDPGGRLLRLERPARDRMGGIVPGRYNVHGAVWFITQAAAGIFRKRIVMVWRAILAQAGNWGERVRSRLR